MKPSAIRILRILQAHQPYAVPSTVLADIPCLDYRKRISELRRAGCVIFTEPVKGKPYSAYRLIWEAQ